MYNIAMNSPILGIDTWEGQLEIDEAVLKANNVRFVFIRLNDMNGGHHKDTGFDKQWAEAVNFLRAPYFVYNPWVDGLKNFQWLQANMPAGCKVVAVDIEVRMSGYPSATYAAEVAKFEALLKVNNFRYVIYTGEWFLSYLSTWNKNAPYWWAQYPYEFYPASALRLTWDDLRARLVKYSAPSNAAKCPGLLKFWQFSGDRLILPGNAREMDVNVFLGTEAELAAFFGTVTPPPSTDTITTPYPGIKRTYSTINGWKVVLHEIDPALVDIRSVYCSPLKTAQQVQAETGADLVINGGENDRLKPINYTVCDGVEKVERSSPQPSLQVTK